MSFQKLSLSPWLLRLCQKIRYLTPTPIQSLVIPQILQGKSLIANAQTGSGKTAAFSLPILHKLAKQPFSIYCLIIAPSHELAMQISQQLSIFGQSINLRQALLVGGVNYKKQMVELEDYPHVVVGTPGRINEMVGKCERFREDVKRVEVLVLDQADRLFQETILPTMRDIIKCLDQLKQVVLATATIDQNFQGKKLNQLLNVKVDFLKFSTYQQRKTVKTLIQKYIFTPQQLKPGYLLQYLRNNPKHRIIIFIKTCKQCTILCQTLKQLEYQAVALHSFLNSNQRLANLSSFRISNSRILVTTDLTSRGLDISDVNMVINYNVPRKVSDYIHRVGRTARNGLEGEAITFVTQFEVEMFLQIEKEVGVKMEEDKDIKEQLDLVSKFNKVKREVKIELMSKGVLDDMERKKKRKLEMKVQMKGRCIQIQDNFSTH